MDIAANQFRKRYVAPREEQNRCQREIERHQNAAKTCKDEGSLLDLARNAHGCSQRKNRAKNDFLLSNCTWEDGEAVATSLRKQQPPLPALGGEKAK